MQGSGDDKCIRPGILFAMGSITTSQSFRIDSGRIGLSEETSDGFLRLYMRLAVADRPMVYRGANGQIRHEAISAEQLFRKDSADTFKMLPLTLRHPEEQIVTPDNARRLGRGSTGHTILREQTPNGDFLGITSTLFDREAINAVKAGWQISPGYRVGDLVQRADGVFLQQGRVGNHVAVVEKARGGQDIIPVLGGINTDSSDGDDLWVVDFRADEEELWRTELNHELINRLFNSENPPDSLLSRGAINLDAKRKPKSKATGAKDSGAMGSILSQFADIDSDSDENNDGDSDRDSGGEGSKPCSKCSAKGGKGKKPCGCSSCSKTKNDSFGGRMAQITVGGIGLEVDPEVAQLIAPVITRADAADTAEKRVQALEAEIATLREENEGLNTAVDELMDLLESDNDERTDSAEADEDLRKTTLEVLDLVDELLEEEDDENRTDGIDEDEVLELVRDGINTVDRIRQDAQMLYDAGYLKEPVSLTPDTILENLYDLQAEMVGIVNKGFKCDAYDEEQISAIYDAVMATARESSASRQTKQSGSNSNQRRDSLIGLAGLVKPVGSSVASPDAILAAIQSAQDKAYESASAIPQGAQQSSAGYKLS